MQMNEITKYIITFTCIWFLNFFFKFFKLSQDFLVLIEKKTKEN